MSPPEYRLRKSGLAYKIKGTEKESEILPKKGGADPLEKLRQEAALLKEQELAKKAAEVEYNPHFDEIDPTVLMSGDLDIYGKFKDESLTKK